MGEVFAGKYRVLRVLGAGGMGVVFEVEHLALGRRSALKLLIGRRLGALAMERFKREAQRLASLRSPAIVQVFDAGQDEDGAPFLEMELLDGASLEDVLKGGPLPPARAAEIVRGALLGLEVAHAAGLVHRDVKPDNVFIVGDPQRSTDVKLLDFGIAKATAEEEALTREGAVLGTVYFMSPEQASSSADADARSDVYSTGATLYRSLTGTYPVEPGPTVSVVAKIVTGQVSRHPREVVASVPPWLDAIVARAMAPLPEDRYASAREMREALTMAAAPALTEAEDDEGFLAPGMAPGMGPGMGPGIGPGMAPGMAPARTTEREVTAPVSRVVAPPAEERVTAVAESAPHVSAPPAEVRGIAAPAPEAPAGHDLRPDLRLLRRSEPRSWAPLAGAAALLAIGVTGAVVMLRPPGQVSSPGTRRLARRGWRRPRRRAPRRSPAWSRCREERWRSAPRKGSRSPRWRGARASWPSTPATARRRASPARCPAPPRWSRTTSTRSRWTTRASWRG